MCRIKCAWCPITKKHTQMRKSLKRDGSGLGVNLKTDVHFQLRLFWQPREASLSAWREVTPLEFISPFFSHRCFFLVCSFIVSPNQAWLCCCLSYSLALCIITDITPCNVLTFTKVHYKTHVVQAACIENHNFLRIKSSKCCPSPCVHLLRYEALRAWRLSDACQTQHSLAPQVFFFKGNFKEHQTR